MEYLYNMLATPLTWLSNNQFDEDQILDQASRIEVFCNAFLVCLPWFNQPQPTLEEAVGHCNEAEKIEPTDESSIDAPRVRFEFLHQTDGNEITEALTADDLGSHMSVFSRSAHPDYTPNQSACDDETHEHDEIAHYRSDDESSTLTEESEQPEYPELKEVEWTDIKMASKAGKMPQLCNRCLRWEDQPEEIYEEKDMVSDKWFMIGNVVFFRKRKPIWAECVHCGFGMPKRTLRGTKTSRIKKFFCKVTGRKYTGPTFVRDGYDWYKETVPK